MIPCTCGREADDCIDCLNDYISNIEGVDFDTDAGIIEDFADALISKDKGKLERVISLARLRLNGVCFCSAYDKSECICGAWG